MTVCMSIRVCMHDVYLCSSDAHMTDFIDIYMLAALGMTVRCMPVCCVVHDCMSVYMCLRA
jgi:hypothetical protein